jgi:hypothetical protein
MRLFLRLTRTIELPRGRWTALEDIHLTGLFLAEVAAPTLPLIKLNSRTYLLQRKKKLRHGQNLLVLCKILHSFGCLALENNPNSFFPLV